MSIYRVERQDVIDLLKLTEFINERRSTTYHWSVIRDIICSRRQSKKVMDIISEELDPDEIQMVVDADQKERHRNEIDD